MQRLVSFTKKPAAERGKSFRLFFNRTIAKIFYIRPFHFNLALGYVPDSEATFKEHPEFKEVYRSFSKYNKVNNGGDIARLWSLVLNLKQIDEEKIEGNYAELGVWRGNTSSVLAYFALEPIERSICLIPSKGSMKMILKALTRTSMLTISETPPSLWSKTY